MLSILVLLSSFGAYGATLDWESYKGRIQAKEPGRVVQNRSVVKEDRWQIFGPLLGPSERKDFTSTYVMSLALRRHFSERKSWEALRVSRSWSENTQLLNEVEKETKKPVDTKRSDFQISSSYILSPIYGKYAWNDRRLVQFDIYGRAGLGLRMGEENQAMVILGFGSNHFIFSKSLALVVEYNLRLYREQRSRTEGVSESLFHFGVSWLM